MSTYIFGDLHGCYDEFSTLLDKIKYDESTDELMFTGDLIGRGPKPVETLNLLCTLKNRHPALIHTVLGNHDLNFLSVFYNRHKPRSKDNLEVILKSSRISEFVDFLTHSPLLYIDPDKKVALSHAGIYPMWTADEALKHVQVIHNLQDEPLRFRVLLSNMYADHPSIYSDNLKKSDLNYWRFIINCFTRMRLCTGSMELDYGHSDCSVEDAEKDSIYPWFEFGKPYLYKGEEFTLFFGHWAALNTRCNRENIVALDSGCVWGNELTCYHLEQKARITTPSSMPKRK
ncbi:MAG: symmetrical bis(5'-nucleosyl)-tetraphosphatase [Succinivibrio sp.]